MNEQDIQHMLDHWRAEAALQAVGITSYAPRLIEITSSVLRALDDAGEDLDDERVVAIVNAHVAPESLCPACAFKAVVESAQLMFAETPVIAESSTFADALAGTIHLAIFSVAMEASRTRAELAEAAYEAQRNADVRETSV
jgi:hypothetical protein